MINMIRQRRGKLTVFVIGTLTIFAGGGRLEAAVHLRASQIGYQLDDPKLGIAFSSETLHGEFAIVNADTDRELETAYNDAIAEVVQLESELESAKAALAAELSVVATLREQIADLEMQLVNARAVRPVG